MGEHRGGVTRGWAWARTVSDSEVGLQRRARETRGDSHTWGLDVW